MAASQDELESSMSADGQVDGTCKPVRRSLWEWQASRKLGKVMDKFKGGKTPLVPGIPGNGKLSAAKIEEDGGEDDHDPLQATVAKGRAGRRNSYG